MYTFYKKSKLIFFAQYSFRMDVVMHFNVYYCFILLFWVKNNSESYSKLKLLKQSQQQAV